MSESFLQDCVTHEQFAKEPDGLPFTQLGNRKIIHLPTAHEWLLKRMQRPNAERRRRRKA
jgi:hypothetical protein